MGERRATTNQLLATTNQLRATTNQLLAVLDTANSAAATVGAPERYGFTDADRRVAGWTGGHPADRPSTPR